MWIGVGALVMWAYSKISGLVRGGPQAAQAKMMSWVSTSPAAHRSSMDYATPQLALTALCPLGGLPPTNECGDWCGQECHM